MIGETGAQERASGEKGAWIDAMRAQVKAWPNIAALLWFDTYDDRGYDWRLRTSTTSTSAWGRLGLDTYFRTRG